jgi:hypothetical protein
VKFGTDINREHPAHFKPFWRWYIALGISEFLDFVHGLSILKEHSVSGTGSISVLGCKGEEELFAITLTLLSLQVKGIIV